MVNKDYQYGWLSGVTVSASNLRSSGRGFDSRSGRYQATLVNSAFHPSGVGKSSTGLVGWGCGARFTCVGWQPEVTLCDPIWQETPRSSHEELYSALTFFTGSGYHRKTIKIT